jgi:outer membrane lipoprotein-sorting protein
MKKVFPLGLLIALIFSALGFATPTTTNGQGAGLVSSVLNRLEKNRASLKSLRAGIILEKYNSQIGTKDNAKGIVAYVPGAGRNASVRLEWTSPQHEILAVANGKYILFKPRLGTAYTGSSNKAPNSSGIMDMMYMSRQQLETKFLPIQDVREETLWGNVNTIHVTLVPKGNASYKYAEIWIDNGGMPIQTKIVEKNDDSTTMRLTALEKNVPISDNEFRLKLDANVKIVKG